MTYDLSTIRNLIYFILFYFLLKLLIFLYKNLIRKPYNLVERYGKNTWAIVTGATDGIGKKFCEELAKIGFNIILISRNIDKLKTVSAELKQINPMIKTHEIEFDFNKHSTTSDYIKIFQIIQENCDISILVNNVGTDYEKMFKDLTMDEISNYLNVNITPQTFLTRIFYEKMANREKRSAIINLSSYAADFPLSMKSLYSATKIFNHYLSLALTEENLGDRVDFLSVKPLGVDTPLSGKTANNLIAITTKKCVSGVLNDLGYEKETYGHIIHKIQAYILNTIPNCVKYPIIRKYWAILSKRTNDIKRN